MSVLFDEILEMPIPDRIGLARDILDSVVSDAGTVKLTGEQMAEIENRLEYHRDHPDDVVPWGEVWERFQQRG